MILKVENLQSKYGLSQVLFDIGLEVSEGESVCILGRNGVGKSTTLKTIIGDVKACGGSIVFNGENIIGCRHTRFPAKEWPLCRRAGISFPT